MIITREDVDAEIAVLKVKISPEDYKQKVNSSLEKYRKQAKLPGFRPGKIPFGMIQKQYGKSVLAEELNKVVNDGLYNFISEQKIEILGNPLPKNDSELVGDFNNPNEFEFEFEIGLSPKIDVNHIIKSNYEYVKLKVDNSILEKQIEDIKRRYGKLISTDIVGDKDLVLGQFIELNDDETVKNEGITNSTTISIEFVEDLSIKNELIGKKLGDVIIINPKNIFIKDKDKETALILGIKEDQLNDISTKFQFTINEIRKMEFAELNQTLFDKLYGEGIINSEEELKERISNDLVKMFEVDSERLLTKKVYEALMEKAEIKLPSAFLKRWIKTSNEKPISDNEIEAQFGNFEKDMKWQLIQGHIFKENNLQTDHKEMLEFTKGLLVNQYSQYGIPAPADKELTETAVKLLKNKEESGRIFDMYAEIKLASFFKNNAVLNEKFVTYDEFIDIVSKKN